MFFSFFREVWLKQEFLKISMTFEVWVPFWHAGFLSLNQYETKIGFQCVPFFFQRSCVRINQTPQDIENPDTQTDRGSFAIFFFRRLNS